MPCKGGIKWAAPSGLGIELGLKRRGPFYAALTGLRGIFLPTQALRPGLRDVGPLGLARKHNWNNVLVWVGVDRRRQRHCSSTEISQIKLHPIKNPTLQTKDIALLYKNLSLTNCYPCPWMMLPMSLIAQRFQPRKHFALKEIG